MAGACPPLIEVLQQVPDPRFPRGKRHPLAAVLAMAVAATLSGSKSYAAIADWGRNYGQDLARALGFTHEKTPCAGTLHSIFSSLDRDALEATLTQWAKQCLATLPQPKGGLEAFALDGKTLRGSRKQGALDVHLLSLLSHRLGLTVAQQAVDDKTNEIPAAKQLLSGLLLEGDVVTMDALLCQREIAQTILSQGGTT